MFCRARADDYCIILGCELENFSFQSLNYYAEAYNVALNWSYELKESFCLHVILTTSYHVKTKQYSAIEWKGWKSFSISIRFHVDSNLTFLIMLRQQSTDPRLSKCQIGLLKNALSLKTTQNSQQKVIWPNDPVLNDGLDH